MVGRKLRRPRERQSSGWRYQSVAMNDQRIAKAHPQIGTIGKCLGRNLQCLDRSLGQSGALQRIREIGSEEHTSELQSLMRISYAVFCLKKKKQTHTTNTSNKTRT